MTQIMAHRGSKGTHPENTLAAFKEAVTVGADGIELDVHLTKDQQLVVIHDETIDRTTNGEGVVQELTLNEIQKYDAGSWFASEFAQEKVPSLKEVLLLLHQLDYPGTLNIELKTDQINYPDIEKKLAELMQSESWSFSYLYSSFNFDSLAQVNQFDPDHEKALIMYKSAERVQQAIEAPFIQALHPYIGWMKEFPESVGETDKCFRPWTVNEPEDIQYALKQNYGAIITDYPEKAILWRNIIQPKE